MKIARSKLASYLVISLVVGLCIEALAQPFAIATSRGSDLANAVSVQVHDDLNAPVALAVKLIPFLGVGLFAAWAARKDGSKSAAISLGLYLCAFALMYLYGFFAAERVFKEGYRTAAALNAGLPFVLAILSLAGFPLASWAVRRIFGSNAA